ncbi:hypothetical protein PTKU46_82890 [Paraburkholderia terrae]
MLNSPDVTTRRGAIKQLAGLSPEILATTPLGKIDIAAQAQVDAQSKLLIQAALDPEVYTTETVAGAARLATNYQKALEQGTDAVAVSSAIVSEKIRDMQTVAQSLGEAVEQFAAGRALSNIQVFQKLSLNEQLDALSGNIDLGLLPARRDELQAQVAMLGTKWANVSNIETLATAGTQTLQVAQTAVALAKAVGVDVPSGVTDAVAFGQKALGIYAAFSVNPVSAVLSAGSLFGSGDSSGSDPQTIAMLAHIQAQLDQVIDLQKQTLKKLDDLDQKMSQEHLEVIQKLVSIQRIVTVISNSQLAQGDYSLQQCEDFEAAIAPVFRMSGTAYEHLRDVFPKVSSDYIHCNDELKLLASLNNSRPHDYLLRHRMDPDNPGASPFSDTDVYVYQPAWQLTLNMLGNCRGNKCGRCMDRLMNAWQVLPAIWPEEASVSADCTMDEAGIPSRPFRDANSRHVTTQDAMLTYVDHTATIGNQPVTVLDTILGHLTSVLPFYDLTVPGGNALKSLATLRKPTTPDSSAALVLGRFLDVLAISSAQEYVLSGMPVVRQVQQRLQANLKTKTFGFNADTKTDLPLSPGPKATDKELQAAENVRRTCGVTAESPITPGGLVCVLERNPAILQNVLTYWLMKSRSQPPGNMCDITNTLLGFSLPRCAIAGDVRNGNILKPSDAKYTLLGFRYALMQESLSVMNEEAPGISWRADSPSQYGFVLVSSCAAPCGRPVSAGWYLKMQHTDGSDWYISVPTSFDMGHQFIVYRPQVDSLRATRQRAVQEYRRYSIHLPATAVPDADMPAASRELIAMIALREEQENRLSRVLLPPAGKGLPVAPD